MLLSDRIVMLTNGPAATIGDILSVPLPRPRDRVRLANDATYLACRASVVDFLHRRHGNPERSQAAADINAELDREAEALESPDHAVRAAA
ncbi:Bicarbonate transport ATP-binding protein CmpD [compost metagenome]